MTSAREHRATTGATIAVAAGLAVVVGRDGTPGWQLVRVAAVLVVAAAAVALTSRVVVPLVVGSVALAVGIGIGGPHLVKTGLSVLTVAGLLVLVGGLTLFASALRHVLPAARRRSRYPARAALVLFPLLLSWTLGQAVAATNVPRPGLGDRTPADEGLEYRDVELAATDGVRLSGWYVPSRNRAAVVLLHGAGSTRSNVLAQAVVLARHGYGVLLLDARGHGRSAGRAMDFGWFGDQDVGGAVAFLQEQPDVDGDRIGAVGMSMGGEEAIGASAAVDAIRAVVAEGATGRVAGDQAWLSDDFGVSGAISEAAAAVTYGFADLLTSVGPPSTLHDAVRAAQRPTLLIAGGAVEDEPRAGRYIRSASPATVELWVVPGAGHTAGLRTDPDGWEARVIGFLDEALRPGPEPAAP